MSTAAGDQMRPFYAMWQARFPQLFPRPLNVLPDGQQQDPNGPNFMPYHILSGALNGVPQTQVASGYVVQPWQAAHEILGHMAEDLRPDSRELFWAERFKACQFRVMPLTFAEAAAQSGSVWAFLPIEVYAEAARLAYTTDGPKDRSMDWGCAIDIPKMRMFFDSIYMPATAASPSAGVTTPSAPTAPPASTAGQGDAGFSIEWVGPAAAGNFDVGRSGNPISLIVDHWTVGSFDSAVQRFRTKGEILSAHYVISTTGRIAQVVRDEDTAFHAGVYSTNQLSIGIEHEASPSLPPSNALYNASAWLHAQLAEKHRLALEVGVTVRPHRDFVSTSCPGTLNLNEIVSRAEDYMFTQDDRDKLNRIKDLLEAREPLVWAARQQRFLDVERGTAYDPNRPPIDARIKA